MPENDDDRPDRRPSWRDRDYDQDDDRPRRRRSEPDPDRPRPPGTSTLGIFSLIGGILSLILSFIPCINFLGIVGGLIALTLGVVGLFVAKPYNHARGLPLAGTIISVASLVVAGLWIGLFAAMYKTGSDAQAAHEQRLQEIRAANATKYDAADVDAKLDGQIIEVAGVILEVKQEYPRVRVDVGDDERRVSCYFAKAADTTIKEADVGKEVVIRGDCKTAAVGMRLEDCIVMSGPKWPKAVPVSAKDLATAFDDDEKKAKREYVSKRLEVSGEIDEVTSTDGNVTVLLVGVTGLPVLCELPDDEARAVKKLKVKSKVTITGECSGVRNDRVVLRKCTLEK